MIEIKLSGYKACSILGRVRISATFLRNDERFYVFRSVSHVADEDVLPPAREQNIKTTTKRIGQEG